MKKGTKSRRKPKRLKMEMRLKIFLVFLLAFLGPALSASIPEDRATEINSEGSSTPALNSPREAGAKDSRGLFSPRMDYEQWKPLGRGDPLQNDPTYDYVPPALERVHYWEEVPRQAPGEGKKSEILVLGVSSKKPSVSPAAAEGRRDPYESFLKFIDGPKYHHHHSSHIRPNSNQRVPHPPSHAFHSQYYKNKFDDEVYRPDERRMPYTVLVPPPVPPPHAELPLFEAPQPAQPARPAQPAQPAQPARPAYRPPPPAAPADAPGPSVSVQEANLIYHSSSAGGNDRWRFGSDQFATVGAGSQYVTWRSPASVLPETATEGNPVVFSRNTSDAQNAHPGRRPVRVSRPPETVKSYELPVVFPTETVGRIVFEQHSSFGPSSIRGPSDLLSQAPDKTAAQTPPVLAAAGRPSLHVLHIAGPQPTVTHMAVGNQPMHKGQVSDDTIGNSYVNIGRPNAHIQKETTDRSPVITVNRQPIIKNPKDSNIGGPMLGPIINNAPPSPLNYASNQINSVYTSGPQLYTNKPAIINNGVPFSRRPGPITDEFTLQTMQTMLPPPMPKATTEKIKTTTKKMPSLLQTLLKDESPTTERTVSPSTVYSYTPMISTTPTPTTTAVASLTTDPLFKHYKQPVEPLKGPMYLIIQGHSKVKTYGAGNKDVLRGMGMPETNEIPQPVSKYSAKHLHNHKESYTKDVNDEPTHSRSKNSRTLKDLVEDGVGNFDVRETEIGAKFDVSNNEKNLPNEKYHKGIVETDEDELIERKKLKSIAKIREKRQLEDFIPVVEDTVETVIYDYLKRQSEGSGVGAIIASAITNDSSEDDDDNDLGSLDDDDDDEDEE